MIEYINGFITCVYDDHWLACAIQSDTLASFLHPCGPSTSFKYPSKEDIVDIPLRNVLTKVNPRTLTGRAYTLTKQENDIATEKLQS